MMVWKKEKWNNGTIAVINKDNKKIDCIRPFFSGQNLSIGWNRREPMVFTVMYMNEPVAVVELSEDKRGLTSKISTRFY